MHSSQTASIVIATSGLPVMLIGITLGPLVLVTGVLMAIYGTLNYHRLHCVEQARNDPRFALRRNVAEVCQSANHAGCLDDPDCGCGCHAERIAIRVRW